MSSDYGFLNIARKTSVEIVEKDYLTLWQGPVSGKVKPQGPLAGKRIGVIVASEFSDFQATIGLSISSSWAEKFIFGG